GARERAAGLPIPFACLLVERSEAVEPGACGGSGGALAPAEEPAFHGLSSCLRRAGRPMVRGSKGFSPNGFMSPSFPRTILAGLLLSLLAAMPLAAGAEIAVGRLAQLPEQGGERVAAIEVEGAIRAEPEAVREAMRTRVGDRFDREAIGEDIR